MIEHQDPMSECIYVGSLVVRRSLGLRWKIVWLEYEICFVRCHYGRWRVTRRGSGNIWWGICKGKSGVWREKEELGDVVGIYASGNLSTNSLQM